MPIVFLLKYSDMKENKKIVIVGPPGTGKTTIKKVFFEMGNPFKFFKY